MKERPILFSAPMVEAILANWKTQTRRVAKWKARPESSGLNTSAASLSVGLYCTGAPSSGFVLRSRGAGSCWNDRTFPAHCPYGQPGDRLYVKEATWIWCRKVPNGKTAAGRQKFRYLPHGSRSIFYVADHPQKPERESYAEPEMVWRYKTARFMPRWASRIALQIDNVSVHRLQEITSADAKCEGDHERSGMPEFYSRGELCHVDWFHHLWDSINAKRGFGWNTNPWVWALTFHRVDGGAL